MPGVNETLPFLAERHDLILFTKGEPAEQNRKIDLSGLRPFFRECVVTKEKNRAAYVDMVETYGLNPDITWMIGNSPKSDINPALAAGLGAVYVPHERTWTLEREELTQSPKLLRVENFQGLLDIF